MDKSTENLPEDSRNNPKFASSSSCSSSSSSSGCSDSEEQDLFQLDPVESSDSPELTEESKMPPDVRLPPRVPVLSSSPSTPKSPTMSGYDPNRIPADVFNRTKSGGPVDWSVASNESLFSIHMGKSQELTAYYQAYTDQALFSPLDPKEKDKEACMSVGDGKHPGPAPKGMGEEDLRNSISGHSTDGSIASHQSFAFPILTNDAKIGSIKNELVKHQTPNPEQMQPPVPLAEAPKEKPEPAPAENKTSTASCFSCLPSFPSCCCWGSSS
ncbi:suppressor SRP40-like protein [Rhynchospora pubera]|uniref:Suppressor SRP40-like protein n=1 Tax=Rhynchospora pubera TaxID=906938 RepID=A0AAV8F7C4_9POAL|nr:suppressor SRP40-like protein [Rhynchospora pubera]KAJ4786698.1 suppressor SRP40-like protein [Rhynchospora pubera]